MTEIFNPPNNEKTQFTKIIPFTSMWSHIPRCELLVLPQAVEWLYIAISHFVARENLKVT